MVAEAERKDELARAEGLKKIPRAASWGEVDRNGICLEMQAHLGIRQTFRNNVGP